MSNVICVCGAERTIDHYCPATTAALTSEPLTESEISELWDGLFADCPPDMTVANNHQFDDTSGIHGDLFVIKISSN